MFRASFRAGTMTLRKGAGALTSETGGRGRGPRTRRMKKARRRIQGRRVSRVTVTVCFPPDACIH
jgi:hypothetical protein